MGYEKVYCDALGVFFGFLVFFSSCIFGYVLVCWVVFGMFEYVRVCSGVLKFNVLVFLYALQLARRTSASFMGSYLEEYLVRRPVQSHGLLYKHRCDSFMN